MAIKNWVKDFREKEGITQAELAAEVDVSRQTVNAIETEKYNPSLELALKMAEFFDAEVEELFKRE